MSAAAQASPQEELQQLRNSIDQLDQELAALLKKRAALVFSIGDVKSEHGLPVHDPEREAKIKTKLQNLAVPGDVLSPNEMESLFMSLVERFRTLETVHMRRTEAKQRALKGASLNFQQPQQVVLWGFGLLGASLYLALNEMYPHWRFQVLDPGVQPEAFDAWKQQRGLQNIELLPANAKPHGQLFVLAAPVEINARHLRTFAFPQASLVIDLGSTKQNMLAAFAERADQAAFTFVGGHPLAGKETSGFASGDPLLFYDKIFCWTPSSALMLDEQVKTSCEILALSLGAKPFWTTAETHDVALAWTSHFPQILSSLLASRLQLKEFSSRPEFFPGVISGLLRISGSPFSMWQPILANNQKNLLNAISEVIASLTQAHSVLETNPEQSAELFQEANEFYRRFLTPQK